MGCMFLHSLIRQGDHTLLFRTHPNKNRYDKKHSLIRPYDRTKWCLSCQIKHLLFPKKRRENILREFATPSSFAGTRFAILTHCSSGYRYLAWCESKISQPPKMDLNSHGPERDILYAKCKDWLEGKKVQPNLTGKDVVDY